MTPWYQVKYSEHDEKIRNKIKLNNIYLQFAKALRLENRNKLGGGERDAGIPLAPSQATST